MNPTLRFSRSAAPLVIAFAMLAFAGVANAQTGFEPTYCPTDGSIPTCEPGQMLCGYLGIAGGRLVSGEQPPCPTSEEAYSNPIYGGSPSCAEPGNLLPVCWVDKWFWVDADGPGEPEEPEPEPEDDVTATLTAVPDHITRGGNSLLTWGSTNATQCTGTNFNTNGATSGSVTVSPAETMTYVVTCTDGTTSGSSGLEWQIIVEDELFDINCGGGNPAPPNESWPFRGTPTCSNSSPEGQSCSPYLRQCKWNRYAHPGRDGDCTITGNLYQCSPPASGSEPVRSASAAATVTVTESAPLSASCQVTPSAATLGRAETGSDVTWSVSASGGTGTYVYSWTGTRSLTGSTGSVVKSYPTASGYTSWNAPRVADPDSGTVTVTSGGQTASQTCSINVCAMPGEAVHKGNDSAPYPLQPVITDDPRCCQLMAGTGGQWKNDVVCLAGDTGAYPDLTAGAITPTTAVAGVATDLATTVTNSGNATASVSSVSFARSSNSLGTNPQPLSPDISTALLTQGASRSVSKGYTFPLTDAGTTVYVQACADSANAVSESSEINNCGPWTPIVIAAASRNLVAGAISPGQAEPGVSRTFSATISNSGSASAGRTTYTLFQRAESAGGAGAVIIGYGTTPDVPGRIGLTDGSASASVSYAFSASDAPRKWMRACADNGGGSNGPPWVSLVAETDENNCGPWTPIDIGDGVCTPSDPADPDCDQCEPGDPGYPDCGSCSPGDPGYPDCDGNGPSLTCSANKSVVGVDEKVTFTAHPSNGAHGPYHWRDTSGTALPGSGLSIQRSWNTPGNNKGTQVRADNMPANSWATCTPYVDVTCTGPDCDTCSAESVTIWAEPDRVESGTRATLHWDVPSVAEDGVVCTITSSVSDSFEHEFTVNSCTLGDTDETLSHELTTQTTFTLSCDTGPDRRTDTVTVNVFPKIEEF